MSTDIPYWEIVDTECVILPVVAAETALRNAIAAVTAALLPGAVLRLPAMCARTLPCDLLLADLSRTSSLSVPIVLLLTLLALLILLAPGLLLFCSVVLLLALLPLLILLAPGLLFCSVILLPLLALLILLPAIRLRRLFLFRRFILFFLFIRLVLPCPNWRGNPEH